ncbi:MAG TPA: hypothetical protein VGL38_15920 [bacterium]|jgi:6-phosphogluconolactonase/glucosamine-6-phosphate isomerase/deaminase
MRRTWLVLSAHLILLGLLAAGAYASGSNGGYCGGGPQTPAQAVSQQVIVIHIDVKDLPHQAASLTARSIIHGIKFAAHAPGHIKSELRTGSGKAQVAFQAATGQTQSTFQRISAGVTSLSLQLLRGAFSYFWALVSGLLR